MRTMALGEAMTVVAVLGGTEAALVAVAVRAAPAEVVAVVGGTEAV